MTRNRLALSARRKDLTISLRDAKIRSLSAQIKAQQKALAAVQALNFSPTQDPALVDAARKALAAAAALQV